MFDDQSNVLEISVYDYDSRGRDDFMGRYNVDTIYYDLFIHSFL
jgi:Ca2+-dependent lipid-binding protein